MFKRFRKRLRVLHRHYQRRYQEFSAAFPPLEWRAAAALRESIAAGYRLADLRADLFAGITVGLVALPLSMALAIACGIPPQYGLYTAIVGGAITAILGGSKVQVSGPTAAFVVVLAPIALQYGISGLLVATMLAGLVLIVLGLARMGRLIQYIPDPVTTGFTMGIAVVIATLQIRDFFGLEIASMPQHYWEKVGALVEALPTFQWQEAACGLLTLLLLIFWPRLNTRIPAPLVAMLLASLAVWTAQQLDPALHFHTIGSVFSHLVNGQPEPGIPRAAPAFVLPWDVQPRLEGFSFEALQALLGPAFAIAMLGAIESLLSATVADGMAGSKHDPDAELLAQGVGNVLAPFFGGFASTGALARTATNIRAGARSPLAAVFHALFVLAAILLLAPALSYLPMASFAALLLLVAWNMSEFKHFVHILRVAPKSDVMVLLACFGLTVTFDMVVAVTAGFLLAALLFMRRMVEVSGASMLESSDRALRVPLPKGTSLYEIYGPLFFGAANKAIASLGAIGGGLEVLILKLKDVPVIDATGLVSLESALDNLNKHGTVVIFCGLREQPARAVEKAGILPVEGALYFTETLEEAAQLAENIIQGKTGGLFAAAES